jgi:purine-binding chemotaxis protein CheW
MHVPSPTIRHCVFRVGDVCQAVPADAVAEVLTARPTTRVPLAPAGVVGLVHLRGRIVPIVDPAACLALPAASAAEPQTHLVLRTGDDDRCGLLVAEVLDVIDVPTDAVERPTAHPDPDTPLVGTFATPQRLVHLVDHARLVRSSGRARSPSAARPGVHP